MASGIYKIENTVTKTYYIGSAVDLEKRLYEHTRYLERRDHVNRYLQNAWNKYGSEAFTFETYIKCSKEDLIFYEQLTIDAFIDRYGRENLYNVCLIAGSTLGRMHSEETKKKIGLTSKGRWTGKKHTEETKEKIRKNNIGKNKGKHHTDEAKKKMSDFRKGKKFSEEHRNRISESLKKYYGRTT